MDLLYAIGRTVVPELLAHVFVKKKKLVIVNFR